MYTIYALVEPKDDTPTWADVRYIGLSENVTYRFQQHLSCHDTSNEDKNEWVRSLLKERKTPVLHTLEEVETQVQGRKREQHWIRYAMAQGAALLNRAITYTEEERAKAHKERAILYAHVAEILEQGTYVKRSACWYPSSLLERYTKRTISLMDAIYMCFRTGDGKIVRIDEATDEEFDAFIRQYIPVLDNGETQWGLTFDRLDAINFAISRGVSPEFCSPPPEKEMPRRKGTKPNKTISFRPDYKRITEESVLLSQSEGVTIKMSIFEALELADWLTVNRKALEDLL